MRLVALFFIFSTTTASFADTPEKPNVIIFFMDDMGYGDCKAYNPESKVSLPNIESLCADGMRFTDAHSPSAVCAPSRYSVMTGNYPWRGRLENGTWMFHQRSQILDGQTTLGQLMQNAGYSTAFLGKVHLGGTVFSTTTKKPVSWKYDYRDIDFSRKWKDGPSDLGFEFSYSLPQGIQGPPYIAFRNGMLDGAPEDLIEWEPGSYGNSVIPTKGFGLKQWDSSTAGPDLIREATGFIDRHVEAGTGKPFFMHYCTESCHVPHTPPKTLAGKTIRGKAGDAHLDMLLEADIQLGMLIAHLKAHEILENTLILFTSDNGGLARGKPGHKLLGHNSNAPLRGSKATIWEGGHRVPLIARWGDGTPTGSPITPAATSSALVGLQDIFATLAELTGQTLKAEQGLDSQSFVPALLQQNPTHLRHELLVQANDGDGWGQKLAKGFREDQWKLIATKDRKPLHLFNLNEDVAEEHDLIDSETQEARIATMLRGLNKTLDSDRSTPITRVTQKPVVNNGSVQPDSISSTELFEPVRTFTMRPDTIPDGVRINAVGTGKWRVRGETPFTLHFKPKNATSWDASPYRLLGVPVCSKARGVVTISARLNNSKPLGWGRHCVGSAVALRDEKTTLGFVFPTTDPKYDGPTIFQDQLGKPNGHRHHWRQFFPADVVGLVLEITSASGTADIEISNLFAAWEATPEREQALHTLPYLDRFGQVRAVEWPGKLHSLEQLKKELPQELADAAKIDRDDISLYGGWKNGPRRQATGRFRTEKIDGRWWFVDPEGYLFFSAGACIAGTEAMTPVTQARLKEHYFERLPTKDSPAYWLTMPTRGGKSYVNFPALNALESLGNRWQKMSRDGIHDRMKMWGLNTLAAWSSTEIRQDKRTPYTLLASIWWLTGKKTPSPFRDDYVEDLCKALENSAWAKNDPYCLGIFIGNEFEWPDRFSQLVFELPDGDTTKKWVLRQIRQKYASLDQLNAAWDASFSNWDQILQHGDTTHRASAAKDIDPLYFEFAQEFFRKSKQAIEQSLPGTLFLGCRCHRGPSVLGRAAVGHADVFSVNVYDHVVRSWQVPDNADIPVIASEFHIGASDRGVPSPGLSSVWDQRQRGLAYARYLASALANPKFVGVHWFQWIDQSAGGRRDRENHQVGLVDVTGRAHVPFVDIVSHVANKKDTVRYAQPSSSIHALELLLADLPIQADDHASMSRKKISAKNISKKTTKKRSPNLVVIMADDLGYADVGFNGCSDIPTSNIDSIAEEGVRFTSGYVAYPVCGPSRASFITGRYGQRFGFERNPIYATQDPAMGLTRNETTIATALSAVGYRCGVVGKWHLGAHETLHPLARGFHSFFGHLGGGHRYFPEELTIQNSADATNEAGSYRTWILKDHTPVPPKHYLTDEFSDASVRFINENADTPFFLFLSYNAPHLPLAATQNYLDRFPDLSGKRKTYAAMVSAVDDGVGKTLDALREHGILDDTLVFFLSDNGGPHLKNASNNSPLRGGKSDVWEGGYRVPFAARYPHDIAAGTTYTHPVSSLDIFATIAELANAPVDPDRSLDGVNLLPFLNGTNSGSPHDAIYIRKFDQQRYAIRCENKKLVIPVAEGTPQLYDLNDDIGEKKNLATQDTNTVDRLTKKLNAWTAELVDPTFTGLMQKKSYKAP